MTTVGNLPRISAASLSTIILSQPPTTDRTIAVIDVRDEDHIGGHIAGSEHIPSRTLDHAIPSLVRRMKDKDTVVFHCALSQQRGPSAALRYVRAREKLLSGVSRTAIGEAMRRNKEEKESGEGAEGKKDGGKDEKEWEDVPPKDNDEKTQKVYVLENGFVGWQETYGTDERLTTGYNPMLWRDG